VLEKLNLQAHQNAMENAEEFITEALLTHSKLKVLVHELLAVELWRQHAFPKMRDALAARNSMRAYFIVREAAPEAVAAAVAHPVWLFDCLTCAWQLYHEAVIVNLLEVVMYYDYACEEMDDCLVDLLDYICRRVVWLAAKGMRGSTEAPVAAKTAKEVYAEMEASTPGQVCVCVCGWVAFALA